MFRVFQSLKQRGKVEKNIFFDTHYLFIYQKFETLTKYWCRKNLLNLSMFGDYSQKESIYLIKVDCQL